MRSVAGSVIVGRHAQARDDRTQKVLSIDIGADLAGGRRGLKKCPEDSLRRLQTDHIDLYQVHRPSPDTDIEETLSALTDLMRAGKVRAIGSSSESEFTLLNQVTRQDFSKGRDPIFAHRPNTAFSGAENG